MCRSGSPPGGGCSAGQGRRYKHPNRHIRRTELDTMVESTMVSCSAARFTLEPSKEVLTMFYPSRHPDRAENEPSSRLVDIHVDPQPTMKHHIAKVLSNACLVRMLPYCTEAQLLSMYKTLVWLVLEPRVGSVCYAHSGSASLAKLHCCSFSLRQLGVAHVTIDSMTTRR